jgi:predicted transcriptional regulator
MENIMTKREMYTAIMNREPITDDMVALATELIKSLDHTNELRKTAAAKKAAEKETERAPMREAIFACITDEPKTATTLITEAGLELKPQAIPSLLKPLLEAGTITKTEIKVTGKGKQVGYVRA